ncbi:MAG: phosphoribosylaminoimidazolesuccinocarboxamide synthase [Oscillospiraceae bacterium]|nr:phosphoribosylaminoimidazolesuccinocarboxamide synthase [Oscillospiraceae bacterium]
MKLLKTGKTKDVYALDDGHILLKFKDDATGVNGVFDPGANEVALSIDGLGMSNLKMTDYYFNLCKKDNIPTHHISTDLNAGTMTVLPAALFSHGVEFICRYRATGSFVRRYGLYAKEGQPLDALIEITLKDDERGDPLITRNALEQLGILTGDEHDKLVALTWHISNLIRDDLAGKGMELIDIKLEFGRVGANGEIALIDEVAAGSMRVYKDGTKLEPMELSRLAIS